MNEAARQKSFEEQLEMMRRSYAERLPAKIDQIGECWKVWQSDERDAEAARALYRMAHSLVGSGRTFGLPTITDVARALQNLIQSVTGEQSIPTPAQNAQFEALLDELKKAVTAPALETQPLRSFLPSELQNEFLAPPETATWPQENSHLILLLDAEQSGAGGEESDANLVEQLQYFGYEVRAYHWEQEDAAGRLRETLERTLPAALLVRGDVVRLQAAVAALEPFQAGRDAPMPVLFLSNRDDLETRLLAVRAGCDEFFTTPVNVSSLSGKLQTLTARQASAFRALVVEDEPALANLYAFLLQQAGLTTALTSDPAEVVPLLHEAPPDLILMDVHLPGCNGFELARAIRQMDAFAGVPILFLSSDAGLEREMAAMHLGGDQFLLKPVRPEHLVAAALSAAQRSRVLRAFMVRDSLTGLYDHTHTKEQLDVELSRAHRTDKPLSLALLDLDDFQKVNEDHSHAHGDRVLKSITRLLRQLVRKTDIVGRYDGDAFAVILPEAAAVDAEKVLDRIRSHFENVCHYTPSAEFCVTFSCGIATLEPAPGNEKQNNLADHLFRAATDALAQAKAQGRNRITLNSEVISE